MLSRGRSLGGNQPQGAAHPAGPAGNSREEGQCPSDACYTSPQQSLSPGPPLQPSPPNADGHQERQGGRPAAESRSGGGGPGDRARPSTQRRHSVARPRPSRTQVLVSSGGNRTNRSSPPPLCSDDPHLVLSGSEGLRPPGPRQAVLRSPLQAPGHRSDLGRSRRRRALGRVRSKAPALPRAARWPSSPGAPAHSCKAESAGRPLNLLLGPVGASTSVPVPLQVPSASGF